MRPGVGKVVENVPRSVNPPALGQGMVVAILPQDSPQGPMTIDYSQHGLPASKAQSDVFANRAYQIF